MAAYADRVQETSATTGTGTLTLGGAVGGYQAFSSAFASGTKVFYTISDGTNWEVGEGTFTISAANTLSRDIVYSSSNAGALVNFPAGKNVFCDFPAKMIFDLSNAHAVLGGGLLQ